jgi:branched-chain amino acid transport system substrate-binding protein
LLALAEAGFWGRFVVGPPSATPTFIKTAGPAAELARLVALAPDPRTVDSAFRAAYRGQIDADPPPVAVVAMDATRVLLAALATQPALVPPDRAAIRAALPRVTYTGLTGPIAFAPDGQRRDGPIWVFQVRAGEFPGEPLTY